VLKCMELTDKEVEKLLLRRKSELGRITCLSLNFTALRHSDGR
jgi:hypothetical protein